MPGRYGYGFTELPLIWCRIVRRSNVLPCLLVEMVREMHTIVNILRGDGGGL